MRPQVIAEFIAGFGRAVEVCCGYYSGVARILKEMGLLLCVCDRNGNARKSFAGIRFLVCDVENPGEELIEFCRKADVVYSIRPPPELWDAIFSLAEMTECICVIRPMSCEFIQNPVVYMGEAFAVRDFRRKRNQI